MQIVFYGTVPMENLETVFCYNTKTSVGPFNILSFKGNY
uniref:Uncharacterized protein n=1 Tax=Arundo donax TaxID=35708 RepID=A0A0A8ZM86_ARUDO